jgi:hypothetical protein
MGFELGTDGPIALVVGVDGSSPVERAICSIRPHAVLLVLETIVRPGSQTAGQDRVRFGGARTWRTSTGERAPHAVRQGRTVPMCWS